MDHHSSSTHADRTLNVPLLAVMTIVILYGIENAASMAQIGWGSITAYVTAALFILIPIGVISAELASGWPHDGGLYLWVREAFGPKFGFFALFQQWVAWVFTIPTVFTFVAVTATYAFDSSLQDNQIYAGLTVVGITVIATGLNFFGVRKSGIVSVLSIVFLAVIPTVTILTLAIRAVIQGQVQGNFETSDLWLFGDSSAFKWIIAGVNSFLGLEMSAYFLKRLRDPQRQYPLVLILAGILTFTFLTLLTLAVFLLSPSGSVSLTAGIMETITALFDAQNISYLVPVLAALIALGGLLKSSTIVIGPAVGLLASARHGHLPSRLARVNKHGAPVAILVMQGVIILIATLAFVVLKNVQTTFFLLLILSVIPYMIAYLFMFAAAVRLRYTQPDVPRSFRVPGGKIGIWIISIIGVAACILVLVDGLSPRSLPSDGRGLTVVLIPIITIILCIAPFVIDRRNSRTDPIDPEFIDEEP
ncbi:MAG: hypothetical protein CMH41_03725 [Micrococcales bacterium]|nr:hypothetical protein [Micrococcales bacterium]